MRDDAGCSLAEIQDLDGYMAQFGSLLARQVEAALEPLHVPGRDAPDPALAELARRPFEAQAHVVTAVTKALRRQRSVLLIGEQGCGKTLMATAAAHAHAAGRPYRALVMCPDHLLDKWRREVEETIPGADVRIMRDWRAWLALADERPARSGAQWLILGRDASKFDPCWTPAVAWRVQGVRVESKDPDTGEVTRTLRRSRVATCPRCGATAKARDGSPMGLDELGKTKRYCTASLAVDPETGARFACAPEEIGGAEVTCGEPLWQFVADRTRAQRAARGERLGQLHAAACAKALRRGQPEPRKPRLDNRPWRWAPARAIHKRLRGFLDYFVIDEAHETKAQDSAQATASGKLIASARRTLAMTGTLVGGYAWHVFHLMYRMAPDSLASDGLEWGQEMRFSERYGRIEETVVTRNGKPSGRGDSQRYGMGRSGKTERRKAVRPGIMPGLYGAHLMGRAVFLGLEEVSSALPPRPADEVSAYAMDADVAGAYAEMEGAIRAAIAPMIVRGDLSLLGRMLQGLLAYPDHPWGWNEIGYFAPFGLPGVPEFEEDRLYPKERALVELCRAEKARGRQVWAYTTMTGVRDVAGRLERLLRREGLEAGVLRASTDRRDRERWIVEEGARLDVAISHPKLVETGLDLFDKRPGGANFATIVFYQTGYNLFTLRQAGRRAWRIGQPKACRLAYLYYKGTMQERAMSLMGRKLTAAEAIDGKFSAEGLAALAGEESAELALARSLSERVESAERAWARYAPAAAAWEPPATVALPAPEEAPRAEQDAPAAPVPAPGPPSLIDAILAAPAAPRRTRRTRVAPGQLFLFS